MRIGGSGVDAVRNPRTFVRADWKDGVTTRGKFEGDVETHRSALETCPGMIAVVFRAHELTVRIEPHCGIRGVVFNAS